MSNVTRVFVLKVRVYSVTACMITEQAPHKSMQPGQARSHISKYYLESTCTLHEGLTAVALPHERLHASCLVSGPGGAEWAGESTGPALL